MFNSWHFNTRQQDADLWLPFSPPLHDTHLGFFASESDTRYWVSMKGTNQPKEYLPNYTWNSIIRSLNFLVTALQFKKIKKLMRDSKTTNDNNRRLKSICCRRHTLSNLFLIDQQLFLCHIQASVDWLSSKKRNKRVIHW